VVSRLKSAPGYKVPAVGKAVLRVFGVAEARLNSIVGESQLSPQISVSYRASFPEVQLILKSPTRDVEFEENVVRLERAIGEDYIFSRDLNQGLDRVVHGLLLESGVTIASAESCTAGMISSALTSYPGSSGYFIGGVAAYSNQVKINFLGVESQLLADFGAVSAPVAARMAEGVRLRIGTDLGVSVTGIAGPDGGTVEKPVGLFYIGVADHSSAEAYRFFVGLGRDAIRRFASMAALDIIRRKIRGFPLKGNH
jgi:nicotinamide-nucleotide amidase